MLILQVRLWIDSRHILLGGNSCASIDFRSYADDIHIYIRAIIKMILLLVHF